MDLINTPINDISNKNEDLIQTNQKSKKSIDISQFFVAKNNHSGEAFIIKFSNFGVPIIAFMILSLSIIISSLSTANLYIKIIISSVAVLIMLIVLFSFIYKIILVKDKYNKKIQIKIVNYLCLPIKKINLELENTHFYVGSMKYESDGEEHTTTRLYIINDYKNLVDIDLDGSNIKKKPAKCIYSFGNVMTGKYNCKEFSQVLNDFVGSPRDYKNPFLFDINNYLKGQTIQLNKISERKYLKYSDHFFSYHLKNIKVDGCDISCIAISFITIAFSTNFLLTIFTGVIIAISVEEKNYNRTYTCAKVDIAINLGIYILYKLFKFIYDNIYRIDCIYSKGFDRIFIGVVKYTKTKYVKTFVYQINNINRFIYENEGNNNFRLKVLLKNNEVQKICSLRKQTQNELEGLICLLNERLITNTNQSLNSYEQI